MDGTHYDHEMMPGMNKIIFRFGCWAFLACATAQVASAQQQPVTTLPLDHMFDAHPAAAGMDSLIHVSLWQRSPWTGVPSAPRTTSLALTSPTASKSLGVGGPGMERHRRPHADVWRTCRTGIQDAMDP